MITSCRLLAIAPVFFAAALFAPRAEAGFYITGSYSTASTNVPFEVTKSQSGSASVDMDLFSFLRIGVSYGLEYSSTQSYRLLASRDASGTVINPPAGASCVDSPCGKVTTISNVQERGAGVTIILWPGDIMPYVTAGAVIKRYEFKLQQGDSISAIPPKDTPPMPTVGAGLGIRLSRDFTLRFSVQGSIGSSQMPGEPSQKTIWDKKTSFSLSYQI